METWYLRSTDKLHKKANICFLLILKIKYKFTLSWCNIVIIVLRLINEPNYIKEMHKNNPLIFIKIPDLLINCNKVLLLGVNNLSQKNCITISRRHTVVPSLLHNFLCDQCIIVNYEATYVYKITEYLTARVKP